MITTKQFTEESDAQKRVIENALRISDKLVPKYRVRRDGRYYSCTSHTAQLWQAVFDGVLEANGYDSSKFKTLPEYR